MKDSVKPLVPGDGTQIYDGSGPGGRGWVHDLERGAVGVLTGVYISSPDGEEGMDLRYHYARFDSKKKRWNAHEIGFAGTHLYVPENHYAGGIAIDPRDINVIWFSADVDPSTGRPNGTGHYQIYRGETADEGLSWSFEQVTFDTKRDNLRPVVPRNRPGDMEECVVWFRGTYNTYTHFDCEIVGIVPPLEKENAKLK